MDEDERKDENIVKGIKGVSKHLGIAGAVRTLNWDVFDQSFDYSLSHFVFVLLETHGILLYIYR